MEPTELDGKVVSGVHVFSDCIEIEFADEATLAEVRVVDGELRLVVRTPPKWDGEAGVRVYCSDLPRGD